jgi:hypothetical protein
MAKANQVLDVNVLPVNQFVATLGEFKSELIKSADMLVSVEVSESDIDNKKAGIASILYGVLVSQSASVLAGEIYAGEPVVLGWHDAVRLSFGDCYKSARGGKISDDAVDKAWSRVMKLLSDDYAYVKPKAETKGAEAKSAKRAEEAEAVAALIAEVPVAELQDRAKWLYNKVPELRGGEAKEALAQAKLYTKAIDKATSAEADALKAKLKTMRADIVALVKQVDDAYVLGEVLEMLQGSVYDTEALV